MQDLRGKCALVTGVANRRSIAIAIAKVLSNYGARVAITYLPLDKAGVDAKIAALAEEVKAEMVLPLDVADPESMAGMVVALRAKWPGLHILIHSIAGAKREELGGRFSEISLEGYRLAHEISGYSLISLVRACRPLMVGTGASVVALTYIGSVRTSPNYNVMGSAKAALEANVRYLAMELGAEGIRVNAVSAGPLRTLASSGIKDFLDIMHNAAEHAPLRRNVEAEEVGQAAAFLASAAASGITGQVLYVDAGYNISGG